MGITDAGRAQKTFVPPPHLSQPDFPHDKTLLHVQSSQVHIYPLSTRRAQRTFQICRNSPVP
eukprot:4823129-Pyramimonas_sp.AAC.1